MQSTESSVCSIIAAFTSGLDIFKRLRQRRKKGTDNSSRGQANKTRSSGAKSATKKAIPDAEELRLSQSLQQGSADVYNVYARHSRHGGQRYAIGDSAAHASLASTLLKLNSGLVSIISNFLSHGRHDAPIDYRSLTSLSDLSRIEAIDALEQLHNRLSRSQLPSKAQTRASKTSGRRRVEKLDGVRTGTTKKAERSPDLPAGIAKVTVNTSQTQLAWARPINKRKGSSSSAATFKTSNASPSSPSQAPSAASTPLPAYSPPQNAYPFPPPSPKPMPQNIMRQPPPPHLSHPTAVTMPQPQVQPIAARRQDKVTPSFYSFATDSTKLGEIPMRKWTVPFNQAEADRLNAQALASGWRPPPPPLTLEQQQKGRSGFMRLFGKGRGAAGQKQAAH